MRSDVSAYTTGSIGAGKTRFCLTAAFAGLLLAFLCMGIGAPSAGAATWGITDYFGNPGATGEVPGGRFSTAPGGVAVRDSTGDFYVVDGGNNRIQKLDSAGDFQWAIGRDVVNGVANPGAAGDTNEKQTVTVGGGATGGSFTLTFGANTTAPISYPATAGDVDAALELIASVGAGNVNVTGPTGGPYAVEFIGTKASVDQAQMTADATGLTPPGGTVTPATAQDGASFEICTVAGQCKAGALSTGPANPTAATALGNGGTLNSPGGIAINQTTGDLYVANRTMRRVEQFDASGNFIRAWGADVAVSGPAQADEEQILIVNAAAGQYKLKFGAEETADIEWNEAAGGVQAKLNALAAISTGGGSVVVTAGPTYPGSARSYLIEFAGARADANQATLERKAGTTPLSGGRATVSVIPRNEGATGFEICEAAASCKTGVAPPANSANGWNGTVGFSNSPSYPAVVPPGPANAGNVLVGSAASVKEFEADGTFVRSFSYDSTIAGPDNGGTANEVQTVTVRATGGTFKLRLGTVAANDSVALPFNASPADVEKALNETGSIGGGGGWVTVTGGPGNETGSAPYLVTFGGSLQGKNISAMVATNVDLSGGSPSPSVTVGTSTEGAAGFEVCKAANLELCVPEPSGAGANGSGVGQFAAAALPTRVAADSAGRIFTVEGTNTFRVQRFTPSGASLVPALYCPDIGGSETLCGSSASNTPTDLAVNFEDDHLYVVRAIESGKGDPVASAAERRVFEFDTSTALPGGLVDTHLANSGLSSVNGLTLSEGGEPAYLTSSTPKAGVYEVGEPTPPTVTIEATTGVTANCATLHGKVNPNGGGPLSTSYRFEYSADGGSSWSQIPASPIDIGNGEADVAVQQSPCGLEPNRDYEVRLAAIKGGSPVFSTGPVGDFTTLAAPPTVQTFGGYWDASAEELVLRGSVNPSNSPTTYFFEYGLQPCTMGGCTAVPIGEDAPAGSGGQPVNVSQRLAEVERNAVYHFRIVADNGVGAPATGGEREVGTPKAVSCGNSQLRAENGSEGLPECRAFEWVSNGDSWGNGVFGLSATVPDGGRAQFRAASFDNPDSSPGGKAPYTAVREGDRWVVRSALPPGSRAAAGGLIPDFSPSPDLTKVLWAGNTNGQEFRGEVHWLIEGIDGSSVDAHGPLIPMTRTGPAPEGPIKWSVGGATPDLSAFIFGLNRGAGSANTGETFLPDEPLVTGAFANLYEISNAGTAQSELRLVNRDDDPSPGVPGPQIGGSCGASGHAISDAGDVVYFSARPGSPPAGTACTTAGNPRRLYKRVDGEETTAIGNPAVPGGDDAFQGSSEDGSVVFFTSPRQLTGSDTDATGDLYVYDETPPGVGQPQLVQASAGEVVAGDHPTVGFGAEVTSVPATAADGSRVYFIAKGRLVSEATKGAFNLYVYERSDDHPGGRIEFIAALDSGGGTFVPTPDAKGGDGRFLFFSTATSLLSEDTDSSADVYRYDDETAGLRCCSCSGDGAFNAAISGSPASVDGTRVVFSTKEGLAEEDDLNGATDIYIWNEGSLGLVSEGSGQFGASSGLLSGDGRNVFFLTRAPLNGADTNNAPDVYVARVDGGFPAPAILPRCISGEECQGPAGAAPGASSPSTPSFNGPGNPPRSKPKPCKKGQVRKKGKCVNKKSAAKKRKRASYNRGGVR